MPILSRHSSPAPHNSSQLYNKWKVTFEVLCKPTIHGDWGEQFMEIPCCKNQFFLTFWWILDSYFHVPVIYRRGLWMKVVRIKDSHIRRILQSMSRWSNWLRLGYFIGIWILRITRMMRNWRRLEKAEATTIWYIPLNLLFNQYLGLLFNCLLLKKGNWS